MKKFIPAVLLCALFLAGCGNAEVNKPEVVENESSVLETVLDSEARGRDSARLGHLNSIIAAIEAYNADNGHYPNSDEAKKGACIGDGKVFDTGIGLYFADGKYPVDPAGERKNLEFDFNGCIGDGKYFYKYVGKVGEGEYYLLTIMENKSNNNIPGNSVEDVSINKLRAGCSAAGCNFYAVIQ